MMVARRLVFGALALAFGVVLVAVGGAASGRSAPSNTWAGTWEDNWGTVSLRADGGGSYTYCDGKIDGTISGATLAGTWTQTWPCGSAAEGRGTFVFRLSATGRSWTGSYRYATKPGGGAWNATCRAGPCLRNGAVTVEFHVGAYANNRRVGISRLAGSGVLGPDGLLTSGHPIAYQEGRNAWNEERRTETLLLRVASGKVAEGVSTRLQLRVVVVAPTRTCAVGRRGTVTIVDDPRGGRNGRASDSATVRIPGCGGRSRSWSNADDPDMYPPAGGSPHGGQWANVRIHVTRL